MFFDGENEVTTACWLEPALWADEGADESLIPFNEGD